MTHGIDTDFLVATEITGHPNHQVADALLSRLLDEGHDFAIAPQILAEFIHVVTDPRRMPKPLTMADAIARTELWWQSAEVVHVFPNPQSVTDFVHWLRRFQLGRKRLLDTLLASTLCSAGVVRLITNNERHFQVFKCFDIVRFPTKDSSTS